jgi:hypothetical protein
MSQKAKPLRPVDNRGISWFRAASAPTAWGSALLFVAFIAQNAIMPLWTDEVRRLERSQLAIDIETARRDLWVVAFADASRTKADPELVATFLVRVLEANKRLLSWSAGRIAQSAEEYSKILADRDITIERARQLAKSRDPSALLPMAARAAKDTEVLLPLHDEKFFEAVDDARSRETRWYWTFVGMYVVGSALVGFDFVRERRRRRA